MKRTLSVLLATSMCFAMSAKVFADGGVYATDIAADEVVSGNSAISQNVVLFAVSDTSVLDAVTATLGTEILEPLFVDSGDAVALGNSGIWYRANAVQDVAAAIDALNTLDGVIYAEPEYIYTADSYGEPAEIECSKDWAYKKLHKHENKYWWKDHSDRDIAPGYATIVAVIDTGVDYTHEDLISNMWVNTAELDGNDGVDDDGNGYIDDIYGADVTASGKKAGNPMDDHGHGKHVAGIIGMTANGVGGVGIAYGAKIMAVKAGYSTGSFSSTAIARAINYAHMMGADVINMSFGGISKSFLVESALESAFGDCVLIASAGNDGIPTTDADPTFYPKRADNYPAGYSYVIGVMASDSSGNLAGFSNWDYKTNAYAEYEMTAPGVDIHSALPGNRYAVWSGTSMAAPMLSAAAAILRSYYTDKDIYSSRFIMGQLASATEDTTSYLANHGDLYEYPTLNILDSIENLPKPNISIKDSFLMDTVGADDGLNDGDSIIEAGETIDLGLLIRNQWGQTGDITVKVDAISDGGVANPFIDFVVDEITLAPAGTFAEVNNGWVYDDSLLVGVDDPIRFTVSKETPNDTQIRLNITVTTTNGVDDEDSTVYTTSDTYTFRVQSGRGISGTISEDTTLTNDYLWIVENAILIPEGVTLTVEPGTKIQFCSSDYEDAYGAETIVYIDNEGSFNAIGTEDEPIEMYPGAGFEQFAVQIYGEGVETLKYCKIINPMFNKLSATLYPEYACDTIDHCVLIQNFDTVYYKRLSNNDY